MLLETHSSMKLVIYTANCIGYKTNCLYPHRVERTNAAELAKTFPAIMYPPGI